MTDSVTREVLGVWEGVRALGLKRQVCFHVMKWRNCMQNNAYEGYYYQ